MTDSPEVDIGALRARLLRCIDESMPTLDASAREQLDSSIASILHAQSTQHVAASREVTILLSDIRGFTALAEGLAAVDVARTLNFYFASMNEIIIRHGGMIDKYMGDSVMALFGARYASADDPLQAVRCGVEMQMAMDEVNRTLKAEGLPELYMGIGINTGQVSAGDIGSDLHREYTVIGDGVNLASRIEAHSLRGQVLISEHTFAHVADAVEVGDTREVQVKGKQQPIQLYDVLAVQGSDRTLQVPRRELRTSPRVDVTLPLQYQRISGKNVHSEQFSAELRDLSYSGFYAISEHPVEAMTEIKFSLSLSMLSYKPRDIYARIVSFNAHENKFGWGVEFTAMDDESAAVLRQFVDRLVEGR